jgi:enoyl-CoA hydratase/carnithine racemase
MADEVLVEVANHVATITLNRPDAMNAMNLALSAGLTDAFRRVDTDDHIRVAILTGNGRAFCAGADLRGRSPGSRGNTPGDFISTPEGNDNLFRTACVADHAKQISSGSTG